MVEELAGRVVLITGAGGGQGRAAALRFAAAGAVVVGSDLDRDALDGTRAALAAAGASMAGTAPVDLADPDQAAEWVAAAAREHGRIDVVYNNASAARFAPVETLSLADWHFTLRNELDLVFLVTQAAWPHLAARGGVVINTGSAAGHRGNLHVPMLAHATTKGGVIAMTRQLAVEGRPHGIRAVSISPGVVETPATAELLSRPPVREALVAQSLVSRLGVPDDVAGLAVFLASDAASYLTGIDVVADGGTMAF